MLGEYKVLSYAYSQNQPRQVDTPCEHKAMGFDMRGDEDLYEECESNNKVLCKWYC